MLTLGIDDAGRGPVIGPMVLAGVLLNETQEKELKKHKIRDSKTVSKEERPKLYELIKKNCMAFQIAKTFPQEIDHVLNSDGTNLNVLEAVKAGEIVNEIVAKFKDKKIKLIVDCPSINTFAWRNTLIKQLNSIDNLEIHCEHKADVNHISAAAASILAKTAREEEVDKIKKQYGNIGSGYPADPDTKEFLKTKGKELADSGIFRKTWATWKTLFPEAKKGQATLGDF